MKTKDYQELFNKKLEKLNNLRNKLYEAIDPNNCIVKNKTKIRNICYVCPLYSLCYNLDDITYHFSKTVQEISKKINQSKEKIK